MNSARYNQFVLKREVIERFEAVFEPDEEGYHVYVPALKGCHSWGATVKKPANTFAKRSPSGSSQQKTREFPSLIVKW